MPASYPTSVKVFSTKIAGQIIEPAHVNDVQDEITSIENGLLNGLAHNLIPDANVGRDIGTPTRRWRDILAQRVVAGDTTITGLLWRVQTVGSDTWLTVNAYYDGTNWLRDDTTKPARAIVFQGANKDIVYYYVAAGANPITWAQHAKLNSTGQLEITPTTTAAPFVLGTNAQNQLVTGLNADQVDGQHLVDLDGRYVNVAGDTMTGTLAAPAVVAGTDPGGTEALRGASLRAGDATFIGTATFSSFTAGSVLFAGTGGTLSQDNANLFWDNTNKRLGIGTTAPSATLDVNGTTQASIVIAGTDPGGTEALRASSSRVGSVSANIVVVGTDPGGTEALRADSARLQAPVLLGSVPQFTMAADPTSAMQVSTKQYTDNLPRYDTVQNNGTNLTQRRILNASTGLTATDDATNGRTNIQVTNAMRTRSIVLVVPGSPTAVTTPATARVIVPFACTVTAVKSTCRVAVSSGTYTYDLNKNGTTMYTTQTNRPTRVAADGTGAKTHTLPDVTSIAAGDVLDVDVDAVGTGIQDFALFVEVLVS